MFVRLLMRYRVVPLDPSARDKPVAVIFRGVPQGRVRVLAVTDKQQNLLAALLGGHTGYWLGRSPLVDVGPRRLGPLDVVVAPNPSTRPKAPRRPRGPRRERCAGPRFELLIVDAPYVRGRVGNRTRRRLCAYLPPSYAERPERRYPVVYLFPGFGSTDLRYLSGPSHLGPIADQLTREVILVGVDSHTVTGSSYFVDSPQNGSWGRFVRDAVAHVDRSLRTIPLASARAVLGQSTGGFNAVSLALRFPDLFAALGASAPDGLDLEGWLSEIRGGTRYLRQPWLAWLRLEDALARPSYQQEGQMISYAMSWSPPSASGLRWPASLRTGRVDPVVWRRWLEHSPIRMLERSEILRGLRQILAGRIVIAVGRDDEFGLLPPARRFSQRLRELRVAHRFHAMPGRHGDADPRLRMELRFLADRLDPARLIGPPPALQLGLTPSGTPSPRWLAAIVARRGNRRPTPGDLVRHPLSAEQRAWLNELRAVLPLWRGRDRLAVERAYSGANVPALTLLVGNYGGDDGFTFGRAVIALDLSALIRTYGAVSGRSAAQLRRLLSHELAHLLTKARLARPRSETPLQRALRQIYYEGLGHYWSLGERWVDGRGRLTAQARKVLRELTPILVERLIALSGSPDSRRVELLLRGLANGPFRQKWGALPFALWLSVETQRSPLDLERWIRRGPAAVLALARRHLAPRQARRLPSR
ncbi:MAG: hypothetical protein KC609_13600 [Myxococcales bacterium]|nr:hypothetical protein [Myxococcales bacterium]